MKPSGHSATGPPPPVVGIVGGLASGKSTVARLLARRGARVVDADRIGHQVLELAAVKEALRDAFGEGIFDAAGRVVHARLAEATFGRPGQVERLNEIVHPPIIEEIRAQVEECKKQEGVPLVVLDAALLMETNLDEELCEAALFVDASGPERLKRAAAQRGISADQFAGREQAQLPEEAKKRRADYVVRNTGSLEELERQLEGLWPELCRGSLQP